MTQIPFLELLLFVAFSWNELSGLDIGKDYKSLWEKYIYLHD